MKAVTKKWVQFPRLMWYDDYISIFQKVNPFTSSKCQDNTSPLSEYRGDPDEISADDGSMTDSYMEISRQIDISPIPNNNMSTSDYSDSIGAAKGGGESSGNRNWEHRRPDSLVGDRSKTNTFPILAEK